MNYNIISTPATATVLINSTSITNDYISIAGSLTSLKIELPSGITFTSTPSLTTLGLDYVTGGNPEYIENTQTPLLDGTVSAINTSSGTSITIETILPTFTVNQTLGLVTITDTTSISNPNFDNRGQMLYYIIKDGSEQFLGMTSRGGVINFSLNSIDLGTYDIKAVYRVLSTFPQDPYQVLYPPEYIIFQTESTSQYTFVEWRPEINLAYLGLSPCAGECCGATVDIATAIIINYNTHTNNESELTYTIYNIDEEIVDSGSQTLPDNSPVGVLEIGFTPTEIGDFRVVVTIDNGVAVCTQTIIIKSCNYLTLIKVADACNSFTITNCSLTINHTYSVFHSDGTIVPTLTNVSLPANTASTFIVPGDGAYYIVIYNENSSIKQTIPIFADCNIKECLIDYFLKSLCHDCKCKTKCKECIQDARLSNLIIASNLFYMIEAKYKIYSPIFGALSQSEIKDLVRGDALAAQLNTLCADCGPVKGKGKCGCKCKD